MGRRGLGDKVWSGVGRCFVGKRLCLDFGIWNGTGERELRGFVGR